MNTLIVTKAREVLQKRVPASELKNPDLLLVIEIYKEFLIAEAVDRDPLDMFIMMNYTKVLSLARTLQNVSVSKFTKILIPYMSINR